MELFRPRGVPMAVASGGNPGSSLVTSLLLMLDMACTLFAMTPGSARDLTIHLHLLVLDGAYTSAGVYPRFHRTAPPTTSDIERLLHTLIRRIGRTLRRAGGSRRSRAPRSATASP